MWTRKRVVGAIAALLAACLIWGVGGYYVGHNRGVVDGVDMYHKACYTISGIVVGKEGNVVVCKGMGKIPEEELKKFLTNGT